MSHKNGKIYSVGYRRLTLTVWDNFGPELFERGGVRPGLLIKRRLYYAQNMGKRIFDVDKNHLSKNVRLIYQNRLSLSEPGKISEKF